MTVRSFVPSEFYPTSPRSGNEGGKLFRMQNLILRGESREPYAEVYGGSFDLGENIPTASVTGQISCSPVSLEVVGAGTAFTTELHLGQFLLVHSGVPDVNIPVVVDEILDDTHFLACRLPYSLTGNATATKLPIILEMNKRRATMLRGSAVELDLGTIIAVGEGTVRRDGDVLPGVSLVASRTPKVALFNASAGTYTVFTLGLAAPATLGAAAIANPAPPGKNMQAGTYSLRAAQARLETRGYGNPSPKAEVTLATTNIIQATLPAASAGTTAWVFFGTLFTQGGGINGPWHRIELPHIFVPVGSGVGEIPAAGGTFDIEYNDAEITSGDLLGFNNDPPPHAEFVQMMTGIPIYISCMGPGNTSPGPFIATGKSRNIEAVPPVNYVSTSPPDTIIGAVIGVQGRLYLMCANTLQVAMATQATDPRVPPFVVRPFWKSGFKNPETLLPIGDNLIGMTSNGLARSIAEGDAGSEEYGFATAVEELLAGTSPGHSLLKLDPKNNAVVLFLSAYSLNAAGWWTTRALMFGLRENKWIGDVLLTSTTGDMIVSSATALNGQLEFLCGGRQSGGAVTVRTYRWDDERAAQPVPWYAAWQFSDWRSEDRPHVVKGLAVVGKLQAGGTAGVHGAGPGEDIAVDILEAGNTGSKSGSIAVPASSFANQGDIIELDVDNLKQFTVRVDSTWPGGAIRDRLDEVVLIAEQRGARR